MKNTIFDALNEKKFGSGNMTLQLCIHEGENQYFFKLSGFSPKDENYCEKFEIDKSDVSTECDQLSELLASLNENFDPAEHALMWYRAEDRGQPKDLQILLNDAWEIKKCVKETWYIVDDFIKLEKQKINTVYKKMGM